MAGEAVGFVDEFMKKRKAAKTTRKNTVSKIEVIIII
jgi:hypothetical protein